MTAVSTLALVRIALLAAIFVATVLGGYRAVALAQGAAQVRRQIRSVRALQESHDDGLVQSGTPAWRHLVELVERSGLSLTDSNPDALRAKLVAAGYDSPDAPRVYTLIRLLLVFALPIAALLAFVISGAEITVLKLYMTASLVAGIGLLGPTYALRMRTKRRLEAITNGFPNCLDLMLVCVEAGLGMEATLDRIGREMAEAEPEVSQMLVRTTLHLRAGASREEALHRMGNLGGVDEVRAFCTLLIQSEKLGTSIATTLRIFAADMRERRRMRAEEKAHRLPVLMSVPLIMCMLPTMVGVLLLPAVIRVVHQLLPILIGS